MSKIENIKSLYKQIERKGKFIEFVAKEFNMAPQSVKNHWLCASGFWSVPATHQDKLIELLQNQIANQNNVLQ